MFKKVDKFLSCGGFQKLSFLVAASISTSYSRNTVYYSLGKNTTTTTTNHKKLLHSKTKMVRTTKNGKRQLHVREY